MSAESDLNNTDYELLSAYIDDMLADSERIVLEQRLQSEPALQGELVALRQTVMMIQQLPTLKAPRDFTLTPEMVGKRPSVRPKIIAFPLVRLASAAASIIVIVLVAYLLTSTDGEVSQEPLSAADVAVYSTVVASPTITTLEMQSNIVTSTLSVPTPQEARDSDGFSQQAPADQMETGSVDDETTARSFAMPDNDEGNFYMVGTPDANSPLETMMDVGGGLPGDAPPEAALGAISAPPQATIVLAIPSPSPAAAMANIQATSTHKDGVDAAEREESAEQPSSAPAVMLDMSAEITDEASPDRDDNAINERALGDAENAVSSDPDAETAQEELKIQSDDKDDVTSRLGVTLLVVGGGSALVVIIYTILRRWRTP